MLDPSKEIGCPGRHIRARTEHCNAIALKIKKIKNNKQY